jgi:hypothetical protein
LNGELRKAGLLKSSLIKLLKFVFEGKGDDPLSLYKEDYSMEIALAARLRLHAQYMPYDSYRERIMGLAGMSEKGAEALGKKIQAMGSGLPDVNEPDASEGMLWEKLSGDVKDINVLYYRYLSQSEMEDAFRDQLYRLRNDKSEQNQAIRRLLAGLHGYSY